MKTQELEKPLEWSELGTEPIETLAQEARRVLSLIPDYRWCTGLFHDTITGQACALGHFNYYQEKDYSDNKPLRQASAKYLEERGIFLVDIASVNNGDICIVNHFYPQETPKQRTIALLDDMIKAGF